MRAQASALLLLVLVTPAIVEAQYPPDLGPITEPVDEVLGQVVPPSLNTTYTLLGQNITREDVRLFLDFNITRGDVGLLGLLIGSGPIEVRADIFLRAELRVIATERLKEAIVGDNPYNISAENATFLSEVYLPAEVFRLTLTAQLVTLFKAEMEVAIEELLKRSLPELQVIRLDISFDNILPTDALTDFSLTEPPIVAEARAVVRYLRTESAGTLLSAYLGTRAEPEDPNEAAIAAIKKEHGDVLRTRDFFAAAAYTQLLNLSMQPGWSLETTLRVPRGYTFEYFSENVEVSDDRRTATFVIDASDSDTDVEEPLVASLTQRRAVALALFVALWAVSLLVAFGPRSFYIKRRLPRILRPPADGRTLPDGKARRGSHQVRVPR